MGSKSGPWPDGHGASLTYGTVTFMQIKRRGLSLIEVSAAIVLLGALATIVMQSLEWTLVERREAERREIALVEAGNAMERLAAANWESLAPRASAEEPLSAIAKEMLPGGRLTTEVKAAGDDPAARRIVVEVRWLNRAGETDQPVRLTTWVYKGQGAGD
jgi:prepilin-type N-terminal cleavage/methylation domain-containing protein